MNESRDSTVSNEASPPVTPLRDEHFVAPLRRELDATHRELQELKDAARAVAVTYCAIRCGFQDHTAECDRLKRALVVGKETL